MFFETKFYKLKLYEVQAYTIWRNPNDENEQRAFKYELYAKINTYFYETKYSK